MTQEPDRNAARRAKATMNELTKAKRSLNDSPVTLLARVALSVVYMYLILMSYSLLGIAGPVFISILFLVAFFIPYAYQTIVARLQKRKEQETWVAVATAITEEARQQG